MIAVFWTELMDWFERFSSWSLGAVVLCLAVSGTLTMLCPEFVLEVAALGFMGFGLLAGMGIWLRVKPWEWVARASLHPFAVMAGRTFAIIVIIGLHLLAIAPVWVLMNAVWGVPITLVLPFIVIVIISTMIATFLGMIGFYFNNSNGVVATLFVGGWFAVTGMVPSYRLLNPAYLVWNLLSPGYRSLFYRGAMANLVVLGSLIVLFGLILFRERRASHGYGGDSSAFRA